MTYDREEWRRPWREGEPPAPGAPSTEPSIEPSTPALISFPRPAQRADEGPRAATGDAGNGTQRSTERRPDPSRSRGVWISMVAAVVGGVIGGVIVLAAGAGVDGAGSNGALGTSPDEETATAPSSDPPDADAIVPAVADAVTPSVVRIDVSADEATAIPGLGGGLGSGVIYSSDGYIITNHHVIDGAGDVTVRLANGDVLQAEVIGSDQLNDIAVLKVERDGLSTVTIRPDDEELRVGETVVAIGSPFGLDASVSAGIISALNREIRLDESANESGVLTIPAVVQTDAAINPGNSGGALVDGQGRLVGINTAILSGTGANQGVGFAVSAKQASRSADQLIEQGFVRHPLLGIAGTDVRPEDAEELGLSSPRGAVVEVVEEGSGAAEADLRPGDVITAVDGEPLATMSELVAEVRRRAPGDVITLEGVRDGEPFEVDVELGERPR